MDVFYSVEYAFKKSFFYEEKPGDNYTKPIKANVSIEVLCYMLRNLNYIVYSARVQTGYGMETISVIKDPEKLRRG